MFQRFSRSDVWFTRRLGKEAQASGVSEWRSLKLARDERLFANTHPLYY